MSETNVKITIGAKAPEMRLSDYLHERGIRITERRKPRILPRILFADVSDLYARFVWWVGSPR